MSNATEILNIAINMVKAESGENWTEEILTAVAKIQLADKKEETKVEEPKVEEPTADSVEVGDIFASSWGWEQTNVTFYQVIKVTKCFATIQKIDSVTTEDARLAMQGTTVPAQPVKLVGEPMRRKISRNGYSEDVKLSINDYANAYRWDGTPQRCSWYA